MPVDPVRVDDEAFQLRLCASVLAGAIDEAFPPGADTASRVISTYPGDFPLKYITGAIDSVLGSFDRLQRALGEIHPRHEAFLRGECEHCARFKADLMTAYGDPQRPAE